MFWLYLASKLNFSSTCLLIDLSCNCFITHHCSFSSKTTRMWQMNSLIIPKRKISDNTRKKRTNSNIPLMENQKRRDQLMFLGLLVSGTFIWCGDHVQWILKKICPRKNFLRYQKKLLNLKVKRTRMREICMFNKVNDGQIFTLFSVWTLSFSRNVLH